MFEKKGIRSDEDMIELKKSLVNKLITSNPCMIFFKDEDNASLIIDGDIKEISNMIGDCMIKTKKFRDIILESIEIYQGKLN